MINFIAQLQVWKRQGDRLLVFIDMNEHVLRGCLATLLFKMGLLEATHTSWGVTEPHTYIRGNKPIDGVWLTPDLEVMCTTQLSFHKGVGDHCSVIVDISTRLVIGKQEFHMVHPHGCCLSSRNKWALANYVSYLKGQMRIHKMVDCFEECKQQIVTYPAPEKACGQMQEIDSQMVEMQCASERQCRQIFATQLPFSKPVCSTYLRCRAYQALSKCPPDRPQCSNAIRDVLKAGIEEPRLLSKDQCLDGSEACRCQLCNLKGQAGGLRQVHLQDCLIRATDTKDNTKQWGILCTIEQEERKSMWRQINRALDNLSLPAIPFVQCCQSPIVQACTNRKID
jgi:hypothetical protein